MREYRLKCPRVTLAPVKSTLSLLLLWIKGEPSYLLSPREASLQLSSLSFPAPSPQSPLCPSLSRSRTKESTTAYPRPQGREGVEGALQRWGARGLWLGSFLYQFSLLFNTLLLVFYLDYAYRIHDTDLSCVSARLGVCPMLVPG